MTMQPLIDGDILVYEVAFAGQYTEEGSEETKLHSFDYVASVMDDKVAQICDAVWATEEPIVYLTGSSNFRHDIAKTKPYKGTRKKEKPFHYKNLRAYLKHKYNVVEVEGLEADDLMVIEQTKRLHKLDTVICSRDKDLRIGEGMHFGWETGVSPQFGPLRVSRLGDLRFDMRTKLNKAGEEVEYVHSVKGEGLKFFYAQLIMGDAVDNIPGLPRGGKETVKAVLEGLETEQELFEAVKGLYIRRFEDDWEEHMLEMGSLLWMVNELDEEGKPVMWEVPTFE